MRADMVVYRYPLLLMLHVVLYFSFIGTKNWTSPGPFVEFRTSGALGKFLGVWSSMNQVGST